MNDFESEKWARKFVEFFGTRPLYSHTRFVFSRAYPNFDTFWRELNANERKAFTIEVAIKQVDLLYAQKSLQVFMENSNPSLN